MLMSRPTSAAGKIGIAMLTADAVFEQAARATFGASPQIELHVTSGSVSSAGDIFDIGSAAVVVIDLDAGREDEIQALGRLMVRIGTRAPVVAVTQAFDESVARRLLQMRVADFMIKPVQPIELVRTCARVAAARQERRNGSADHNSFCRPSVAPASPRYLKRRCCCSPAVPAGGHRPSCRSRFPTRCLR